MTGYTRQESYQTGDSILASHTNNELDQLEAAFNAVTGHSHDGTAAEGGPITVIMDTDGDTKIQVEETADEDIIRIDCGANEVAQFTATGFQLSRGGIHDLIYNYTVGTADNKKWAWRNQGTQFSLYARSDDDLTNTEALRFLRSGTTLTSVTIFPNTTVIGSLTVNGNIFANGTGDVVVLDDGTAALPPLYFGGDSTTGIYAPAFGELGFTVSGVSTATVTSTGLKLIDGTAADPSYSFVSDTNTGMYSAAADTLGLVAAGVSRIEINGTKAYFKSAPQQFTVWEDTDAALNQKKWRITSTGSQFSFGVASDDELTTASAWYVNRGTGTTVDDVNISAPFKMFNTAYFQGSAPKYQIYQTGGSLDNKRWDVLASSEQLQFNVVNDAESVSNPWMTVDRTTTTPDLVTMYSGILSKSTTPSLGVHDTNSGLDGKIWKFYTAGATFNLGVYSDADSIGGDFINFTRTGNSPTSIAVQTPLTVVGLLTPQGGIDVSGTGDTVSLNAGTAALPSLIFGSDTDTGLYQPSLNRIGFSSFGAEVMSIDDSDFRISHPSNSSFIMTDTGGTLDNKKFQFYVNNGQLSCWLMNDAESVTTKLFEVSRTGTTLNRTDWNKPFALEAGTAALPSLTFQTDLDTGIYSAGVDIIGFSAGTTAVATIGTTGLTTTFPNGSAASPSIKITGTNTGFYKSAFNGLGISFNGTAHTAFESGSLTCNAYVDADQFYASDTGTAFSPAYTFTNDSGTGFYSGGTASNIIHIACNEPTNGRIGEFNATGMKIETTAATARIILDETDYVSGTTVHMEFKEAGVTRGSISSNGTNTAYNTTSDYRLKENVVAIDDAVDCVKRLKPCRFNFIGNDDVTSGFIAHEVQEVVAEAVTGEKDGEEMQQMDAAKLVPILTAALQNALDRIEALEARNN